MTKKMKIVSYTVMQSFILIGTFLIILLSLKYNVSMMIPLIMIIFAQIPVFMFLFSKNTN